MTGPKDTVPPPAPPITSPQLPTDEPVIEMPIRKGEACYAVIAAYSNLVGAVVALEKVAMAIARALDGEQGGPKT